MSLVAVGVGGALGAMSRYGIMSLIGITAFPYGTLIINVVGSFLLGALMEANALHLNLGMNAKAFLVVGFLGSFTTLSAFSMETILLIQKGELGKASVYICSTVAISLIAFVCGMMLLK